MTGRTPGPIQPTGQANLARSAAGANKKQGGLLLGFARPGEGRASWPGLPTTIEPAANGPVAGATELSDGVSEPPLMPSR